MSNDLIRRNAVINLIRPRLNSSKEGTLEHQRLYSLLISVENLPTAYDVDKVVGQPEDSHNKGCLINRNATIQAVEDVLDDESFDATMVDYLQYGYDTKEGLLALFYRNLWAQANLYERLKYYEDLEQGLLLKFPCKVGDTLYRIDTDEKIENTEIEYLTIENIVICEDGEVLFKYDSYDGIICHLENIITDKPYLDFYRVFLTRTEAEEALKRMESEE